MVLVDTSVWIRFLANRAPYAQALDQLLAHDESPYTNSSTEKLNAPKNQGKPEQNRVLPGSGGRSRLGLGTQS